MFGFYYITFVGVLILVPNLKEADSFAIQMNGERELDFPNSAVTYLPSKASKHTNITEEVDHNEEMIARLKRTTLTTTIDGKFTVHLIVSVKPAEQVFQPQIAKSGRQTGRRIHNPIPKNCENEHCDFAMELELLKQESTSVDPTVTKEETNKSRTTSEGQVKTSTPVAKTVPKFRTSHTHATSTRYPMLTPSIKQALNRTKLTSETTTRYPTSISRPFIKQVFNRTRIGGRYQATTTTRTPVNVTRVNRIRSTGPASNNPLSWDSTEDYFSLERRNSNAPNKSRAQQQIRGKPPKAATKLFQSNRIQKKKEADSDVIISRPEKNEPVQTTTDGQIRLENVNHSDKQNVFNMTFDGPIFRNVVEQQNVSDGKVHVFLATKPPEEEVATLTTIRNATLPLPVSLDDRIMSNVTQLHEFSVSMEPISIQNDSFVTQSSGLLDIPLESSTDYTTTEQTLQNHTQTDAPFQATISDNPISVSSEEPDIFPWEQIGDFEFQINPKSKQVVNIRILTTTTTTASFNPLSISYEQQGNSSLIEGEGQQIFDAEWGTPVTTSKIPVIVIPTQTVTPTVKLPIPLNRRKPIAVTQSDRVDNPLELSKDIIPITATQMVVVDREQTVISDGTQISTTQNTEVLKLSGEEKQVVNGITETATSISAQQTTILDIPVKTEIIINAETVTSRTPIAEIIPTQSEPTTSIQPPIPINRKPIAGESNFDENMSLEPVRKLVPNTLTSMASDIPFQTTSTSPILEFSKEFPWEQRHDYEVQINPKTNEIVNIRMLTLTTHHPLSTEVGNDQTATPDSTHVDLTRTNESVLTAEEQDELTVEVLGRILDRNGIIRKLVVPRPRDNIGEHILVNHSGKSDDDFPDVKVGTRIAFTIPPKTVTNNRERSKHGRKPIFSHSSEDGVFYFRYANEEDELKLYRGNANDRNTQIITDDERAIDWNTRRDDLPQRESPYFYYRQDSNSSALVKSSCYIVLLIACVSVLFL